tara:strand:+ start:1808 stop:2440 length:633 start_codon:yes stop_codon:yes gene_type:complete
MTINLYNTDCLQALREMPDNMYDLAICDPPYGINNSGKKLFISKTNIKQNRKYHKEKGWDTERPSAEYFDELQRVSVNQIIWGGNYFADLLPASRGWCAWDKIQKDLDMSDGELAWTSFCKPLRIFVGGRHLLKGSIHPTQKPVRLYEWILSKYAKQGDRILDTHLGSGSIAVACHNLGYSLDAYEIDAEYFAAAAARLHEHQRQLRLFL